MGKTRKKTTTGNPHPPINESKTLESTADTDKPSTVQILYRGQCPKLTPRGTGELSYEIGIDGGTQVIRISGNTSSGAFNHDWVDFESIRKILEAKGKEGSPFPAIVFRDLFTGKSSNNHGYLAAILKAEGVLTVAPDRPTALSPRAWDPLLEKIEALKKEGVNLTDHIAIAAEKRAKKKALLLAKKKSGKGADADGATAKDTSPS